MTDLLDIQCPSCGVIITVDGDCVEFNCPGCGASIDVSECIDLWWEPEDDERYDE
jgi:predicted RNA-binding Zn-ribbon protein involved in translation (DUF1610 family)